MTKYQKIFDTIKHYSDYDIAGEDVGYKVIIDHEAKEIILQFEETDSKQDWKHNIMFLPWRLKLNIYESIWVTHGYACAYKSTGNKPLDVFGLAVLTYPEYKRIIRGWSFGSAMAKIAVRQWINWNGEEYPLDEVITYGDVKCFLNPFWSLKVKSM